MTTYSLHTLSNGLRVVYARRDGNVAYCGLAVNAGSRDENSRLLGLAHFVEHTIFKGTRKRRAWHILNRMERIGGELNAYTTKEETLVYSIFPTGNMARAVELIADLVTNSIFPERELEKEREVVREEIQSYRDTPSEAIFDDFEDLIFKGTGLGHNILGTEECLNNIQSSDCMEYLKKFYVPENMVLFAVGSISDDIFFRLAERHFGGMHKPLSPSTRIKPVALPAFNIIKNIDSHQTHSVSGTVTFGMHDPRKYSLLLLNNMLGGPGMNSILNVAIREKRGYAYSVESSLSLMSDCGLFTVYFGSDQRYADKCLKIIAAEIDRLASATLKPSALEAAKKQFIGQLLVSSDNTENYALSLGKGILNFGKVYSTNEIAERIKAVSADELRDAAQTINGNRSILIFN